MIPGGLISTLISQAPSEEFASITLQNTVTVNGVTFNFNKPMPVCYSCLGDPVVISSDAFQITSITPDSSQVETSAGSGVFRVANGAMINPLGTGMSQQGFDGLIEDYVATADITPYSTALNADPATSGAINVSQGQQLSVVKSVRCTGLTAVNTSNSGYRTIDRYVILTVLNKVPFAGFFRPAPAGNTKVLLSGWREANVDYSVLRNFTPVTNQPSLATALTYIRPTLPFFQPDGNGEKFRRLNTEFGSTGQDDQRSINYSRDFGLTRGDALARLHVSASNAEKRELFLRVIQHGIDLAGEINTGFTGAGGAGMGYGRQEFPYFSAFALGDNYLLSAARAQLGSTFNQHFWVKESDIGSNVYWPTPSSQNRFHAATYLPSDVGIPEWEQEPNKDPRMRNASLLSRYREFYQSGLVGAFATFLLQSTRLSMDGVQAVLNGPNDATNERSAALNYYDRMLRITQQLRTFNGDVSSGRLAFIAAYRNQINATPWVGRPDWFEYTNTTSNYNQNVTVGNGLISFNWSAGDAFITSPTTRHDVRYSLDGVDWVEVNNVGASTGTITGLTKGVPHEVSYRRHNALGAGRWTPTYGFTSAAGGFPSRRNRVAPTGTETDAPPLNTIAPKIFTNIYPEYAGELYTPAPTTLTVDFMRQPRKVLTASLGYWTGFPGPTFAYQWRANGVNIVEATSKDYSLSWFTTNNDVIDCVITATNSQGTVNITTASVTVPTEIEPILPSTLDRVNNIKAGVAAPTVIKKAGLLENVNNGRRGVFAIRGKLLGADNQAIVFLAQGAGTSSSDILRVQRIATNQIRVTLRNASAQVMQGTSTATLIAGTEFTLLCAWDLNAATSQIWLNGVNAGGTATFGTITDIPYTTYQPCNLFGTGTSTGLMPAEWDYVYLNLSSFVDLSIPENRDRFLPANIGGWGDGPTGTRPQIFAWGDAESYNDGVSNKGIGGILTPSLIFDDDGLASNDVLDV